MPLALRTKRGRHHPDASGAACLCGDDTGRKRGQLGSYGRRAQFIGSGSTGNKAIRRGECEVSIGTGKYLGEGVYLEVERGLGPGSARGRVEVEVTPRITVETEVGGNLGPGIGIKWKRNY